MKPFKFAISLLVFPLFAIAQTGQGIECTMGEQVRRVVVESDVPAPLICEVAYYKDTEAPGERQALWNAQNDAAYCDARSEEFVAQLEEWGWTCAARAENDTE
jgi:hypothetical protein